jgi:DNA-binding winged helix-turn-helix (wHTH) protein
MLNRIMKLKFLVPGLVVVILLIVLVAARTRSLDETDYATKRAMLVVRGIGHKLLLYAGDSTSLILPVKEIGNGRFQLEFQSPFAFMPDSLVSIVRRNISASGISNTYMVNVYDCSLKEMVYGFEIAPLRNNFVSCLGRVQPRRCYTIQITFTELSTASILPQGYAYLLGMIGFCLVALIGSNYFRKEKKSVAPEDTQDDHMQDAIKIGLLYFQPLKQIVTSKSGTVELSSKESKLLGILAAQQNQLIARDRLLKEVWEDEGVFTGRSLDMFISKLRKKLSSDPLVQIVSVHGKGYKLEVHQG